MKKSILQFSVIAAIAASMTLTTSCSSDDGPAAYVPEPVQFSVGMSDMSVKASTRTQSSGTATGWTASIDGKLAEGDLVFICMKDADGNFYRKAYKVSTGGAASNAGDPNTLTENTSGAIGKFYWNNKTEYKQYQVFSFGNSTITGYANTSAGDLSDLPSDYTYTVPDDQTDINNKTEFLFGYGTLYYASSGTKALKASHQLARIDVTLETEKNKVTVTEDQNGDPLNLDPNNTPGDTSNDITSFNPTTAEDFELKIGWAQMMLKGVFTPKTYSIENTGTADHIHSGSFADTETGSWAAPGTGDVKGQITPRVLEKQRYNTSTEKFETQYSAVVMPQDFTGKDLFTIKYDGAEYKYTIPDTPTFTIEPGKHYKFKVTLQNTKITVTVAIQNWVPVDNTGTPVELNSSNINPQTPLPSDGNGGSGEPNFGGSRNPTETPK